MQPKNKAKPEKKSVNKHEKSMKMDVGMEISRITQKMFMQKEKHKMPKIQLKKESK